MKFLRCAGLLVITGFLIVANTDLLFAQSTLSRVISGYVRETGTNKPIAGASVFIRETRRGTTTDRQGFYTLTVSEGTYNLLFSHLGYLRFEQTVTVPPNRNLNNISLAPDTQLLNEVTVKTESPDRNVKKVELGVTQLPIQSIIKMPALMGEVDVMRSLLLLPGVTTVGEGATGINVRGGSVDQNLVLLDDAPIYNSSHLMGFFSVFNPDAVRDVTLQKGSLPARYGGRTSAVLDVRTKEPDAEKLRLSGGVGLISNRLGLEGPLAGRKLTFLADARLALNDFLFKLGPTNIRDVKASFYDLTTKLKFLPNERNTVYLSGYASNDRMLLPSDSLLAVDVSASQTGFDYQTANGSFRWTHTFNEQLSMSVSAVFSRYRSAMSVPDSSNEFRLQSELLSKIGKIEMNYQTDRHRWAIGLQATHYRLEPNTLKPGPFSNVLPVNLPTEYGLEAGLYAEDEITVNEKASLIAGLRYSQFLFLGPTEVRTYAPNGPRRPETLLDRENVGSGAVAQQYGGLEPRLALRWALRNDRSLKLAYTRTRQFLQLVTNTTAALPTSRWKLSDNHIRPQIADQFSAGYFRNFQNDMYEASAEVYYRQSQNAIDYRDGAKLLLNPAPETDLVQGQGRAYGLELMLKKNRGFLTGWASYAFTRTHLLIDGPFSGERINSGRWYPANFDKPHAVNVLAIYRPSLKFTFSANYTYSTGRPMTVPYAKARVSNVVTLPVYLDRNQQRIPDYHRLDLSLTWEKNPARKTRYWYSWTFSVYNLYARKNAYSVFYRFSSYSTGDANKLSIFGSAIPSLTYNFKL
ncbi:TonB-dependent receptor domain-containing protein [Larkinella insperata]|uniref:TonB-dependent receptor domain-containing protein n=1 Tax=Larkinella insperata TaxID=332158 RepID=A0ABW3QD66_9BACT|nr:TonB-dependent receptor [Larkinella insperata]